jgi:hypothetical protein
MSLTVQFESETKDVDGKPTQQTLDKFTSFSCSEIDISSLQVPEPEDILGEKDSPPKPTSQIKSPSTKDAKEKKEKEVKSSPLTRHRSSTIDSPKSPSI